jgi:hypothetical protein
MAAGTIGYRSKLVLAETCGVAQSPSRHVLRDLRATAVTVSATGADVSGTYGVDLSTSSHACTSPQTVTASRTRAFERERRRRILAQWISLTPSVRQMTDRLKREHGLHVSHMTVQRDLAAIRALGMASVMERDYAVSRANGQMQQAAADSRKEADQQWHAPM